jgi:uncharacterized protein YndB with AHSA1/START domain
MNFVKGGYWLYAMVSPEGQKHWARADILETDEYNSFKVKDGFSDENGNIDNDLPCPIWLVKFEDQGNDCIVRLEISFQNPQELDKLLEMGFREGFTMALENLDELLERG